MARARQSVAAYVELLSEWAQQGASSYLYEHKDNKSRVAFSNLVVASLDVSAALVAHGCLDDVMIVLGSSSSSAGGSSDAVDDDAMENMTAIHLIVQSVFSAVFSLEWIELPAMIFLLGVGGRISPRGRALLRKSHLLQTIRTFYHVFLTTELTANTITARAALQQLVTIVFARMARADEEIQRPKINSHPTTIVMPSSF